MAEAMALCRALVADNITTVIATPHELGQYDTCNEAETIRQAVSLLNESLLKASVPLKVVPGAEIRVDERIPALLREDRLLTLADTGRFILLELPHETFIDLQPLLAELADCSIQAIISHPERNDFLIHHPQAVEPWLEQGAVLQITASSLLDEWGKAIKQTAWAFLASGVSMVATDTHNLSNRRPRISEAFNLITRRLGEAMARCVCLENPGRVLSGEEIATRSNRIGGVACR